MLDTANRWGRALLFALLISGLGCGGTKPSAPSQVALPPSYPLEVRIEMDTSSVLVMKAIECRATVFGGDGNYSYIWDLDASDGSHVDGTEPTVQSLYPKAGRRTLSVHVADASGAMGQATAVVDVIEREYALHPPIELRHLVAPKDQPHIIEGYEIVNPDGGGISLRHCQNVVIRNCYIHDCDGEDARAIYAEDCHGIIIQSLYVKDNGRGILVEGFADRPSSDVVVRDCVIAGSEREDGLSFRNVERVEVSGNAVSDNGRIWEERISGISFNGVFRDVTVHHNRVVRSNSDGIELMGYEDQEIAAGVAVYANVLRANGEQGIWLFRVKDGEVHHNYIEGSHNNGICLEGWVSGVSVHCNTIVNCGGIPGAKHHGGGGIGIQYSCDNTIRANIIVDSTCGDVTIGYPGVTDDWTMGLGARFRTTAGNRLIGNVLCSSEANIIVAESVSSVTIRDNIAWQREDGRHYHGCRPDDSNIEAEPLFRAPRLGDWTLLSGSPGYNTIARSP